MIVGQEQLYFIRFLASQQLHGGNASDTVPRLYQLKTATREAKKMNLFALDRNWPDRFVEVIPAFVSIGEPIEGPHEVSQLRK